LKLIIKRIQQAKKKNEYIVIFGDYDADGISATAIVWQTLHSLGWQVMPYVPFRYTEGYGLNKDAIRKFSENNVQLIITVDCGISNLEEVKYANEFGIDVLITDHHTPPSKLPDAVAIINPKCEHPDIVANLAGVGVAYKFIYHLYKTFRNYDIIRQKKYLELVAIGTITDVVPLIGDNRIFVKHGIDKLNREKSLGLYYLIQDVPGHTINTTTIGFGIGPRINAAGRLDSANVGIELLTTRDKSRARQLANELNDLNEKRKLEGEKIFIEAIRIIEQQPELLDKKVIVLSSPDWQPGVIGIVTSQLAKHYERPCVLITTKGTISRGSIRSFAGMDIFSTLEECRHLLINYGGHREAAGFEIDTKRINDFKEEYTSRLDTHLRDEYLFSVINIDYVLDISQISRSLYEELRVLEPFGEGNREPIFLTKNINAIDYYCVGKDKRHLKVLFIMGNDQIEGIGYKMSHYMPLLEEHNTVDVAYNLCLNQYNGRTNLQLKLVDIKPSKTL